MEMGESPGKPVSLQHDAVHVYGNYLQERKLQRSLHNSNKQQQAPNPYRYWAPIKSKSLFKNMPFCMPLILMGTFMLYVYISVGFSLWIKAGCIIAG